MGSHRLASLRHRHEQFERQMTLELSNQMPDEEAMRFFETQKRRIRNLIVDIESTASAPPRRRAEAEFETVVVNRASA